MNWKLLWKAFVVVAEIFAFATIVVALAWALPIWATGILLFLFSLFAVYASLRADQVSKAEFLKYDLLSLGWVDKGDVLVRYSNPRLGWKPDGTLIIGYHEYPKKVYTLEELNKAINETEQTLGRDYQEHSTGNQRPR